MMSQQHIGKICPHCNTPIQQGDTIAVCDTCQAPQHLACWQANLGCTTPDCHGSIREVLQATAPVAAVAAIPMAAPAPVAVAAPQQADVYAAPEAAAPQPMNTYAAPQPPKKKTGKIVLIVSLIVLAVAGLVCATIFLGIPYFHYMQACAAMDNGEYDTAYEAFVALDGFHDSKDKAEETLYKKACAALENGDYATAYDLFVSLKKYEDSKDKAEETLYKKACAAFDNGDYDTAYDVFVSLGEYDDSAEKALESRYQKACAMMSNNDFANAYTLLKELETYEPAGDKLTECVYAWVDQILKQSTKDSAKSFAKTVELQQAHYAAIYEKIVTKINDNPDFDYWDDTWSGATYYSQSVYDLLQQLPASYEDVALLSQFFGALADGSVHPVADYMLDNPSLIESLWDYGVVQSYAENDAVITYFLLGYWETADGYYFLRIYNDGGSAEYNLPWVNEPVGTAYFSIESMVFLYEAEDGTNLADVYRFELVDHDTMKVYCYEDGQTYTLYR